MDVETNMKNRADAPTWRYYMRKTIKKLVALSMASLLFGGTVCIPVYGKSGVDNVSEEIYVDLSDRVLKEGGYLQGDTVYDSESGMCVYTPHQYLASDENSYEKAAQRLWQDGISTKKQ